MEEPLHLDPAKLVETAERLARRIDERFPDSGLHRVCEAVVVRSAHAIDICAGIQRPQIGLRLLSGTVITIIVTGAVLAVVAAVTTAGASAEPFGLAELIQVAEALVNDIILLGAAVWFFLMLERRRKRSRVVEAVNGLRTLAHLVDVHQLTKSPEAVGGATDTESSPTRNLAPWQLGRYLDYCSEMLALISKVAALYTEAFDDGEALEAVTDLENLCIGLQRKIWQKLVTLESRAARLGISPSDS